MNENDSHCNRWRRPTVYICICNAVTDREIRQAAALGVTDLQQLRDSLGVATCCGSCESCAREILQEACGTSAGALACQSV